MKKPAAKKTSRPAKAAKPAPRAKKSAPAAPPPPRPKAGRIDPALIEQIGEIANRLGLGEVEVQHDDLRIRISRHSANFAAMASHAAPVAVQAPAPAPVAAAASQAFSSAPAAPASDHAGAVKSPMVGTAYLRPSPNDKAFVEIGSTVKTGDKLLLVEAMKTFNEIVAPRSGTVTALMVEDGQPVEYGQILAIIE
ncbi:MAG: acetyl-CoA carboxylase biotin carboxyl carrier protein [Alphaproteobacteria bacterium]|nr:acetyl-CoA carboxylase biotin carboxyl carrier protein [Alphaproteobacteria bacterium]